jgi:hypothetical protein
MFDPKSIDPRDITIGDYVRSHDFPDGRTGKPDPYRPACYVEGWVRGFEVREGCSRYVIQAVARVWEGKPATLAWKDRTVFPPENGTPNMGGEWLGVELVRRPSMERYECTGTQIEQLQAIMRSLRERESMTIDMRRDVASAIEHVIGNIDRVE